MIRSGSFNNPLAIADLNISSNLTMPLFEGCSLFRKTTKTTSTNKQETNKQTYLNRSSIQTTSKETNTYTWWKDSIMYQFQNVKEQIDQAKSAKVTANEKKTYQTNVATKENGSLKGWIYIGILAGLIGCYLVYKYLRFFSA